MSDPPQIPRQMLQDLFVHALSDIHSAKQVIVRTREEG